MTIAAMTVTTRPATAPTAPASPTMPISRARTSTRNRRGTSRALDLTCRIERRRLRAGNPEMVSRLRGCKHFPAAWTSLRRRKHDVAGRPFLAAFERPYSDNVETTHTQDTPGSDPAD